jgi:hypothetical protein
MNNYTELAKKYSKSGYSVIPVTIEKVPAIRDWTAFKTKPMTEKECDVYFKRCWGIALLCGGGKRVTGFDADLKYDLSGDIFDRFKEKLPKTLLGKMYIQSTVNKGFHMIFSCDKVEPNQKLASRYTTAEERHQTYMEAFQDVKTRDKALKIASHDSTRIIFETRGGSIDASGGYVVMHPTPNYKFISGKISHISVDEYDLIMETARSFNDVIEVRKDLRLEKYKEWKLSPFEDFNNRGDVVSLLMEYGWEECKSSGKSIRLKRAGNTKSGSSALFDTESRIFNCFSTSTSFDVGRGYSPTDVFTLLECDNDLGVAFKKLISQEYGQE